jgi:sec-independent protein translocase protein TatA
MLLSPLFPGPAQAYSMPGIGEWIVILVIVLVIFGPGKLPMLGESLGKSLKSFKKAMNGQDEIDVTPPDQIPGRVDSPNMSHSSTADEQRTRTR